MSNKPNFAEIKAQKRQEIKEYKESQSDDGWTVVKPKKGGKVEEINVAALVEAAKASITNDAKPSKKTNSNKKEKSNENSGNTKEIKNRVNNELKKEENIKAVIDEIQGKSIGKNFLSCNAKQTIFQSTEEITQPTQNKTKKKARRE